MVESQPSKLLVAGSIPVSRSIICFCRIEILVEAAGVEPASEKARREKNYVRFRFGSCRPPR